MSSLLVRRPAEAGRGTQETAAHVSLSSSSIFKDRTNAKSVPVRPQRLGPFKAERRPRAWPLRLSRDRGGEAIVLPDRSQSEVVRGSPPSVKLIYVTPWPVSTPMSKKVPPIDPSPVPRRLRAREGQVRGWCSVGVVGTSDPGSGSAVPRKRRGICSFDPDMPSPPSMNVRLGVRRARRASSGSAAFSPDLSRNAPLQGSAPT